MNLGVARRGRAALVSGRHTRRLAVNSTKQHNMVTCHSTSRPRRSRSRPALPRRSAERLPAIAGDVATGRAGASGRAVSVFTQREFDGAGAITRALRGVRWKVRREDDEEGE